jgi:hypothetical protein
VFDELSLADGVVCSDHDNRDDGGRAGQRVLDLAE